MENSMLAIQHQLQDFDFEKESSLSLPREFTSLPLADIVLPQKQPRRYFDSQKLSELTCSIRQHGVLEPLLVRRSSNLRNQYELVAGERRYRAAKKAGITEVPVVICHFSDEEAITISLIENLQREDLNPVEETEGILILLSFRLNKSVEETTSLLYQMNNEQKKVVNHNVMVSREKQLIQEVFKALGQMEWNSFVSNRLPLLKLPEDILEVLRSGKIAYTKAKALASVKDDQWRQTLIEEAINQNLSLSQIRKKIKESHFSTEKEVALEQKAKATLRCLTKSRLWENPKKKEKFKQILTQLEILISE